MTSVAQLKPLDPSRLNVVGEDHTESGGARRVAEAVLAQEVFAAARKDANVYWQENEFAIDEREQANVGSRLGDPPLLGLATLLHFVAAKCSGIAEMPWTQQLSADDQAKRLKALEYLRRRARSISRHVREAFNDLKFMREQHKQPITPEIGQALKAAHKLGLDCAEGGEHDAALGRSIAHVRAGDILLAEVEVLASTLAAESASIASMAERLGGGTSVVASGRERSKAMHAAAANHALRRGVWKVGDSHALDLNKPGELGIAGALPYALVTRDEFNAEYRERFAGLPGAVDAQATAVATVGADKAPGVKLAEVMRFLPRCVDALTDRLGDVSPGRRDRLVALALSLQARMHALRPELVTAIKQLLAEEKQGRAMPQDLVPSLRDMLPVAEACAPGGADAMAVAAAIALLRRGDVAGAGLELVLTSVFWESDKLRKAADVLAAL